MELRRLRYYQGVGGASALDARDDADAGAAKRRLSPGAISEVTPSVLRLLGAYVARKTGTAVTIP